MFRSRWIFGLLVIIIGVFILLNNLDFITFDFTDIIFTYWPVLVILLGLNFISNWGNKGEVLTGVIILFIGAVFLGRNTGLFYISLTIFWRFFWPTIIIVAGISLLTGKHNLGKSNFAIMGGIEKKREPWLLESSSYTAFMGGVDLDLTIADMKEDEIILDLTAFMGGIEIVVPREATVFCQGNVILGGLDLLDKSTGGIFSSAKSEQYGEVSGKVIKIYCRAIMGGIDIKSR